MNYSKEETDPLSSAEAGQEDVCDGESSTPATQHRRNFATCALATFAIAALTWGPSTQSLVQDHRRLSGEPERRLSIRSAARATFSFIIGIDAEDDEHIRFVNDGTAMAGGEEEEQCPGQDAYKGLYVEIPRIWMGDLGELGIENVGKDSQRTFKVHPNHTLLEDDNGVVNGVMFNVEAVPDALPQDLMKPRLSQMDILGSVEVEASRFYGLRKVAKSNQVPTSRAGIEVLDYHDSIVEVMSRTPTNDKTGGGTVFASGQGFLAACMTAFAHHLPLALTPDDMWTVIANGFARHVDANAEELRSNFVDHEGQKEIRVREDSMVKNGSPPEQWEELIFPQFTEAIANNTNNAEVVDNMVRNFTTSTVASQAASEILLMSTMKNFFKFQMDTMCGIPNVRLEGTRDDWESLRERTKTLAQWMLQNNTHGDLWVYDIVLPILDEFLLSYDGDVNYCFWQNMVKFRTSGMGSGSYDFLSGWLPTLFPYLSNAGGIAIPNPHLRHWLESATAQHLGPRPNEIPEQMSSVPVLWNYFGVEYPMHFHAGFRGVHQEDDGTVRPIIGWYVTEDPSR